MSVLAWRQQVHNKQQATTSAHTAHTQIDLCGRKIARADRFYSSRIAHVKHFSVSEGKHKCIWAVRFLLCYVLRYSRYQRNLTWLETMIKAKRSQKVWISKLIDEYTLLLVTDSKESSIKSQLDFVYFF